MKSAVLLFINALATMLLGGCGIVSSESMYEGVRSQQKANSGGVEPKQPICRLINNINKSAILLNRLRYQMNATTGL